MQQREQRKGGGGRGDGSAESERLASRCVHREGLGAKLLDRRGKKIKRILETVCRRSVPADELTVTETALVSPNWVCFITSVAIRPDEDAEGPIIRGKSRVSVGKAKQGRPC